MKKRDLHHHFPFIYLFVYHSGSIAAISWIAIITKTIETLLPLLLEYKV